MSQICLLSQQGASTFVSNSKMFLCSSPKEKLAWRYFSKSDKLIELFCLYAISSIQSRVLWFYHLHYVYEVSCSLKVFHPTLFFLVDTLTEFLTCNQGIPLSSLMMITLIVSYAWWKNNKWINKRRQCDFRKALVPMWCLHIGRVWNCWF